MSLRRFGLSLAGGLLAGFGLAWLSSQIVLGSAAEHDLKPGVPYAVEVTGDRCDLDLEFSPDSRYLLIVSTLGSAGRTYSVTCEAGTTGAAGLLPVRPVEPLGASPLRATQDAPRANAGSQYESRSSAEAPTPQGATAAAAAASPPPAGGEPRIDAHPASSRSFYLHVADGSLDDERHYVEVKGDLLAQGKHVRLYLDRQQPRGQLVPGLADEILRLFDAEIIPTTGARLGMYRDVDGDGGFAVLLSPWLERLQGGRTSLGGFVRGSDFRTDLDAPFSNCCDMMYLNATVRPGAHLKTLLAHEYAHAVCFSERLPHNDECDGLPDEEDWLNEAIAHCAENFCDSGWSNLDYRVSRFLNDPARCPLVVPDYYRSGLWRDHGCRGATYLFLRWCVDQFGEELLAKLVSGPERGTRNLELATGRSFADLYRRWSIALVQNAESDRGSDESRPLGYRTLSLRGRLASWGLVGPHAEEWDVDAGRHATRLKGTATTFLELRGSGSTGLRRVSLRADAGSRLQVSLVRIADDQPRVAAEASWGAPHAGDGGSADASSPSQCLRVDLSGKIPAGLTVEMIACEWNSGETKQSHCFCGQELVELRQAESVASAAGASIADANAGRRLRFELPVAPLNNAPPKLIVKVAARDAKGRPVTAWTSLARPSEAAAQAKAAPSAESALR